MSGFHMDRTMHIGRAGPALIILASVAILGAAFAFQYVGGLAPCVLCIWQRYAYGAAIALAVLALAADARRGRPVLVAACGIALLIGAGLALYHVGVEQHWWQGTAACGASTAPASSIEELRAQLLAQPVVRCDEIAWSLFGISMAGYNFLLSLGLACFAFYSAARVTRPRSKLR